MEGPSVDDLVMTSFSTCYACPPRIHSRRKVCKDSSGLQSSSVPRYPWYLDWREAGGRLGTQKAEVIAWVTVNGLCKVL